MKKVLSVLLVLCMVFCLFPVQARADGPNAVDVSFWTADYGMDYGYAYYTGSAGEVIQLVAPAGTVIVGYEKEFGDYEPIVVNESNWTFIVPDAPFGRLTVFVEPIGGVPEKKLYDIQVTANAGGTAYAVPTEAEAEKMQLLSGQLITLSGRAQQLHADTGVQQAMEQLPYAPRTTPRYP